MTNADQQFIEWIQDEIISLSSLMSESLKMEDIDMAISFGHKKNTLLNVLGKFKQIKSDEVDKMGKHYGEI